MTRHALPLAARGTALLATLLAASAIACAPTRAQTVPAAVRQPAAPTNDAPNPYRTVEGWARMPSGRAWGSTSAVDVDPDGRSIWVAERCGANSCATSDLPSVLKFDSAGALVASFGGGMIVAPHGIFVGRDGHVWVTDCACTGGRGSAATPAPAGPPKGHQIFEFAPDGRLLRTLGVPGGGRDSAYFWQPNDVLVAPDGSIFVAEGHSSQPGSVARVLKLDRNGKLLKAWGQLGAGPNDMNQPHALAMDSRGRLFVGDRGNDRIQIYDQDGRLLDTWYQFSRPSGIFIDARDTIYVADSESGSVAPSRPTWKRGIRIGSARTGVVTAFIPDPAQSPPSTSAAEGVAVDARGNVYGAEVGPRALKRYVRRD